jgi:hypothetical protein
MSIRAVAGSVKFRRAAGNEPDTALSGYSLQAIPVSHASNPSLAAVGKVAASQSCGRERYIAIENKFGAREAPRQLKDYRQAR